MIWTTADAAHLLRRAGFDGNAAEIRQLHALGKEGAIDYLLNFAAVPDATADGVAALGLPADQSSSVTYGLLYRMLASPRPLEERLTWFWHGHFTSSLDKCGTRMGYQLATWRRHCAGDFRAFLHAMFKDAAMLVYLDNRSNVVGKPNENFAREVMELFTLGIGNYSETDIREAARALTGWTVPASATSDGVFVPSRFDSGSKTVLGISGALDGGALMDILLNHPATAERLCRKLYAFFVAPEAPAADIATLLAAAYESRGHLGSILATLFRLDSFWSPANRGALVKSPLDFLAGLHRQLSIPPTLETLRSLAYACSLMGQRLLNPPDVAGYPQGLDWADTSALLNRYNSAYSLIYASANSTRINALYAGTDVSTPQTLLATLLQRVQVAFLSPASEQAILAYLADGYDPTRADRLLGKVRGALHLLVSTPEYQLA